VRSLIGGLLALGVACDSPASAPPVVPPGPIERLASPAIEDREAAADELFARRDDGALRRALESPDAEVRARAQDALDALESLRCFPMKPGHRWTYASEDGDVVFTVLDTTTLSGTPCFAVRRRVGGEGVNFFVSVTRAGVRIVRVGADAFTPPYLEIAFPLREGATWQWSGSIGARRVALRCGNRGRVSVTVPLGTYQAWHIREDAGSGGYTDIYLAEGPGVVKLEGKMWDMHNPSGREFTWQLKEFRY